MREDPSVVTGLARNDSATVHELSLFKKYFELGSDPTCDIALSANTVSKRHLKLERRPMGLQVTDLASKNGTYVDGQYQSSFILRPGKTFTVGVVTHSFLALNDPMRAVYPVLLDILGGPEEHSVPSSTPTANGLILTAINGDHLLITASPHCEQHELARIVHSLSNRHTKDIVEPKMVPTESVGQLELLQRAARSTLVIDLGDDDTQLPSSFMSELAASQQVRVIVLAHDLRVAHEALGLSYAQRLQPIWLRALASRTEAIERLLDRAFTQLSSKLRVSMMRLENQQALRRYHWPRNFRTLREVAGRLAVLHRHGGNVARTASECKIGPSSFYEWYANIGLSHPLIPEWKSTE